MTYPVRVEELVPGEIVTGPGQTTATFVARTSHPLWPHLALVIWKMEDGRWSHDALDLRQVVGGTLPSTPEERTANLRKALLHRSQW